MEQKKKIMIVDDNLIDQMITAHVLKTNLVNREVLVMESAILALDYLQTNENNPEAIPSIIFLDLDMPGMNGIEFMQHFKNLEPSLKNACRVIVLTGSDIQADIESISAEPDVVKLLTKPLRKHEIIPMI